MMAQRRTDLALEAHEAWGGGTLPGAEKRTRRVRGFAVTEVRVTGGAAARALGKPPGAYVTVELDAARSGAADAARTVGEELRRLLGAARSALVVGLGNAAMTPDAVGPLAAEHVLVTRHLRDNPAFASFAAVSVLTPGVLGRTGLEAAETIRGAVAAARPDAVIAVDALASRSLSRLCGTVQLSDAGIVPGSGVGNRRAALNRETLGVPVIAVGVPTVVDAATLALDVLDEAGATIDDPAALRGHEGVFVTTRDIDAQIRALARVIGCGVNLALQPIGYEELCELME